VHILHTPVVHRYIIPFSGQMYKNVSEDWIKHYFQFNRKGSNFLGGRHPLDWYATLRYRAKFMRQSVLKTTLISCLLKF